VARLDKAVLAFEPLLTSGVARRKKKPIPWKKVLDGIATVTGTLSKVTDPSGPKPIDMSKVIDMPKE